MKKMWGEIIKFMESIFLNFEYSLLFIIILFTSTFKDITFILKTFYNMLKVLI